MNTKTKFVGALPPLLLLFTLAGCAQAIGDDPNPGAPLRPTSAPPARQAPGPTWAPAFHPLVAIEGSDLSVLEKINPENVIQLALLAVIGEGDFAYEIALSPDVWGVRK